MFNLLSKIQKHLIWAILISVILGIVCGYFVDTQVLKLLIMPLTFMMVYPMMVNLQIRKLFIKGGEKDQLIAQVINFAIIPFIGFGLVQIFFQDQKYLALGMLLMAVMPTSGMTISWTMFAKGNMIAAIKMTVVGLLLSAMVAPFYIKFLMGTSIDIPLLGIFKQIALVVFVPMVFGQITQRFIIAKYGEKIYKEEIKQKFPPISTLGVLGIVFVAMSLKAETIISKPESLIMIIIPLLIFYFINYVLTTVIGKMFLKRKDAIALVYGTVMRNLSIALAIAMTVFGKEGAEIALIIALAYIIQVKSAAIYIKLVDKIFGKDK